MSGELSEFKEAIKVVSPSGCPTCGWGLKQPYDIQITHIESGKEGWTAHGKGRYYEEQRCPCPRCAALYNAIVHTIPILCAPFPCPNCNELQNLNYKIRSIKTDEDSFEFEADIECNKCKKKKSITKIIKKIFEVIKIEVKPTEGIIVKKA